jgi:hypothetical protein
MTDLEDTRPRGRTVLVTAVRLYEISLKVPTALLRSETISRPKVESRRGTFHMLPTNSLIAFDKIKFSMWGSHGVLEPGMRYPD